jgi:hypothetical protein
MTDRSPQPVPRTAATYISTVFGRATDQLLLLPIADQVVNWEHTLTDFAADDVEYVAWLWDEDEQSIVAALFDPTYWTEEGAKSWLVGDAAAAMLSIVLEQRKTSPIPATIHYLRKLVELLKTQVEDSVFVQAVATARAYAGGKLRSRESGEPDPPDDQQHVLPDEQVRAQRLAVATTPSHTQPYIDEETGYIWKPILRAATVYNGRGESITITSAILAALVASFGHCGIEVDIPLGHVEDRGGDAPELNTGWVRALDLRDDGQTLWAALDFTDQTIRAKALEGSIGNVSVWIEPDFVDLNTGKVWAWALWHVALTNKPQMTGLAPFARQPILASIGTHEQAEQYEERITMAVQTGDRVLVIDRYGTILVGVVKDQRDDTIFQLVDSNNPDIVLGWYPASETVPLGTLGEATVAKLTRLRKGGAHSMAWNKGDKVRTASGTAGTVADVKDGTFVLFLGGDSTDAADGVWLPEDELTAADGATPAGETEMTDAQMQAFARRFGINPGEIRTFKQERELLRTKARKQEVEAIVAALEGRGTHDLVTQVDGSQHHPVVVEAVATALRDQPAKLKLSVGLDGTAPGLDDAILSVVNALPEEARLSLKQPTAPKAGNGAVSKDDVKKFREELGRD